MPDWKALGEAHGFARAQIEWAAPKLEAIETVLRTAFERLPLEAEPATTFDAAVPEDE